MERNLLILLLGCNLVLVVLHFLSYAFLGKPLRVFDLNAEGNVPTWWSSVQLLMTGLFLGLVALRNCRVDRMFWLLGFLAAVFVLMSMDEASGLHEKFGKLIDNVLVQRSDTIFHYTGLWFLVLGVPFVILMIWILHQLSRLLDQVPGTRLCLLLGFAVLLIGAVGIEATSNFAVSRESVKTGLESQVASFELVVILEEFFEMTGGSLLLWASFLFAIRHSSLAAAFDALKPMSRSEVVEIKKMPNVDARR